MMHCTLTHGLNVGLDQGKSVYSNELVPLLSLMTVEVATSFSFSMSLFECFSSVCLLSSLSLLNTKSQKLQEMVKAEVVFSTVSNFCKTQTESFPVLEKLWHR